MKKNYNPSIFEEKIYSFWEINDCFKTIINPLKNNFCILLPPPNITGNLHMGHAFQQTIMDIIIRYQRMKKKNILWQGGTDHAGIATHLVVENYLKHLHKNKIETLMKQNICKWKSKLENNIVNQMRSLGLSLNWDRYRFTLDNKYSLAVNTAFIKLYEDNLIYKDTKLVNWDPVLSTAISDLEVIKKEEPGKIWYIKYFLYNKSTLINKKYFLTIATTRPETILGDVAIAFNPYDVRYRKWLGKFVFVPLTNRKIPVISDINIKINNHTGCVKITPAHDFNDYEIATRNNLPLINIFDNKARIKSHADVYYINNKKYENIKIDSLYENLDRFKAREKILNDLYKFGYIIQEKNHVVNNCYNIRNNVRIEPMLTPQWYLKTTCLSERAIKVVKDKKIQFIPKKYQNIYFSWMKNIKDWCISRQIMWGHRIPIWYDNDKNIYVGNDIQHIKFKYGLPKNTSLHQDSNVLDTWFSSALWSFASMDWPINNKYFHAFYPTDVLVTGYDIIFFWVARMIMLSIYLFKKQIPFKKILITGLICDDNGQKMSKSKGNVIDPLDLINGISLKNLILKRTKELLINNNTVLNKIIKLTNQKFPNGIRAYGADSLRLALTTLSTFNNREIKWSIKQIEVSRNFCNKLWNLSRYILNFTNSLNNDLNNNMSIFDKWIISEYYLFMSQFINSLTNYRFDLAIQQMRLFVWNEFCDWYIEFTKPIFKKNDKHIIISIKSTLITILESLLRLIHPIIPYITEEIWQHIIHNKKTSKTIMLSNYPVIKTKMINIKYRLPINYLKEILISIRSFRNQFKLSREFYLYVNIYFTSLKDKYLFGIIKNILTTLENFNKIFILDKHSTPNNSNNCYIVKIVRNTQLFFMIQINKLQIKYELIRIKKQLKQTEETIKFLWYQLNNKLFLKKAPFKLIYNNNQKLNMFKISKEELLLQIHIYVKYLN